MGNHGTSLRRLVQMVCIVALTGLAACGGGGGVDGGDDTFVPNFEFLFGEIDGTGSFVNPQHRFFFSPTCSTAVTDCSSGSLSNSSNEDLDGSTNQIVSGSFNRHDMTFTVDRSGTQVAFSGRFTDKDNIRLSEPGRTYTVRRTQ